MNRLFDLLIILSIATSCAEIKSFSTPRIEPENSLFIKHQGANVILDKKYLIAQHNKNKIVKKKSSNSSIIDSILHSKINFINLDSIDRIGYQETENMDSIKLIISKELTRGSYYTLMRYSALKNRLNFQENGQVIPNLKYRKKKENKLILMTIMNENEDEIFSTFIKYKNRRDKLAIIPRRDKWRKIDKTGKFPT